MKLRKLKSPNGGRLRRTALALGLAGGLVGGMLLTAGPADAALGTQPGTVNLVPPTGATSSTPTWATTIGCPAGFQGSAIFEEVHSDGVTFTTISPVVNSSTTALNVAFSGTLQATIATIQSIGGIPNGGTQELFVQCASGTGGTGSVTNVMSIFITYSTDGLSYSTTSTPPLKTTTTTLTTSSATTDTCTPVTLTATEVASDATHPAGNVQFQVGGTALGSAVAVNTSGVATTTTTFTSAGTFSVTAVFTATATGYSGSTSAAVTETVTAGTTCNTGSEPMTVTIPTSGTFTLTVPTTAVPLTVSGSTATGTLNNVTVSDTRNTYPGWSVSGQSSDFTGSGTAAGASISGNQLGWTPTSVTLATGAALGGPVTPAAPGLGTTAATLALAHAATPGSGFGTSVFGAGLTLAIPTGQRAGPYAATMTITAVTTLA